jgi:hypothetical protein
MILFCAVLMAWVEPVSLAGAFDLARQVLVTCFPKSLWPGTTYTGFIEVSLRHGDVLLAMAQDCLRKLISDIAARGGYWEIRGWVPFGTDGSRGAAPRTKANLDGLGGQGRDAKSPQAWITTILHLMTGLPWAFTVGRGNSSERGHLKQMLGLLPPKALLIADAGYVGYDLWLAMMQAPQAFLIRVGANVKLIKGLAQASKIHVDHAAELVWLWPKDRSQPPMMLRLVVVHDGKSPVYLVTNVLEESRLSAQDVVVFYKKRWMVEVWFRSMKQTMEKRKLRSRAPSQAMLEQSWAALGLAILGLMQVEALIQAKEDPCRASCAGALKVVRRAIRTDLGRRKRDPMIQALAGTLKDNYQRKGPKRLGGFPSKKQYNPPGPPEFHQATPQEQLIYQGLKPIALAIV